MPTMRGFVERLEVGRGGLAVASLLHEDGSRADYLLPDLDADPERFNERLSKLGLLRDAMSRAEPVEVEFEAGKEGGARLIERVVRVTRDMLDANGETQRHVVFVVGVGVLADNRGAARAESGDLAHVVGMTADGGLTTYLLDLQNPERAVATALLQLLREAQQSGQTVTLTVDAKRQRIVGVEAGGAVVAWQPGAGGTLDGFVESVVVAPGLAPLGNLAMVEFTTAPPFSSVGNVVPLLPFTPGLRRLLVVQGSAEYELFVAGLRDSLRMRVLLGPELGRQAGQTENPPKLNTANTGASAAAPAAPAAVPKALRAPLDRMFAAAAGKEGEPKEDSPCLVRATQLIAALASASRPVWISIARNSLDLGPDGDQCTEGLPSSDLTPQSLRDLHLPYTAEWVGWGCFNHGVYRLQFELGVDFELFIDDKPVCLHASEDGKQQFAHACLHDEHEVRVVLTRWTCAQVFRMDVYRIR